MVWCGVVAGMVFDTIIHVVRSINRKSFIFGCEHIFFSEEKLKLNSDSNQKHEAFTVYGTCLWSPYKTDVMILDLWFLIICRNFYRMWSYSIKIQSTYNYSIFMSGNLILLLNLLYLPLNWVRVRCRVRVHGSGLGWGFWNLAGGTRDLVGE